MDKRILAIVKHHYLDAEDVRRHTSAQNEVIRLYKSH